MYRLITTLNPCPEKDGFISEFYHTSIKYMSILHNLFLVAEKAYNSYFDVSVTLISASVRVPAGSGWHTHTGE